MFHNPTLGVKSSRLRVVRRTFLGQQELGVSHTSRANLERFTHELVLGVDLAIVAPVGRLGPACRDGWVVADLFRNVAILLVKPDVLERLALASKGEDLGNV